MWPNSSTHDCLGGLDVLPRSQKTVVNREDRHLSTHRCWPLLIASGAWGLTAIYEWWFSTFYDPQSKYDIRIDLGLAVIVSFLITAFAAAWSIRPR
jgi:hypothetical protein